MSEKNMFFVLREEEPWNLSSDIKKLNPAGELPVFIFDGNIIYDSCEVDDDKVLIKYHTFYRVL